MMDQLEHCDFRSILDIDLGLTGLEYLQRLVQRTAQYLGVEYVIIGRPEQERDTHIMTDVVWSGDQIIDNLSYEAHGTPCEHV